MRKNLKIEALTASESASTADRLHSGAIYEPPRTRKISVKVESGFCAASVLEDKPEDSAVTASNHDVQTDHYVGQEGSKHNPFDFTNGQWD